MCRSVTSVLLSSENSATVGSSICLSVGWTKSCPMWVREPLRRSFLGEFCSYCIKSVSSLHWGDFRGRRRRFLTAHKASASKRWVFIAGQITVAGMLYGILLFSWMLYQDSREEKVSTPFFFYDLQCCVKFLSYPSFIFIIYKNVKDNSSIDIFFFFATTKGFSKSC